MNHPTIKKTPDLQGHALAWKVADIRSTKDQEACLGTWLVYAPWAHPFWHTWAMSVVHLRDIPGVPPAHKKYPEAEYELLIAALDPNKGPDPDHPENGFAFLHPIDVVEQFHGISDRDATRLLESAVRAIVAGTISPDSDYRSVWRDSVKGTVEHYRSGVHMEN